MLKKINAMLFQNMCSTFVDASWFLNVTINLTRLMGNAILIIVTPWCTAVKTWYG
jgi:hypothetical protein